MKKLLAVLLAVLVILPTTLVLSASAEDQLVSEGKPYEISGCGHGYQAEGQWPSDYTADLTDGVASDKFNFGKTRDWFGFYYNKSAAASVVSAPGGIGSATIDLGSIQNVTKVRAHLENHIPNGVNCPSSLIVSVSKDGETFTDVASLDIKSTEIEENKVIIYWTEKSFDAVAAQYVRFTFTLQGVFAFVNELEVYADPNATPAEPLNYNIYANVTEGSLEYESGDLLKLVDGIETVFTNALPNNNLVSFINNGANATVEFTVDLGETKSISGIYADFYSGGTSAAALPADIKFLASNDNVNFFDVNAGGNVAIPAAPTENTVSKIIADFSVRTRLEVRFVKVIATLTNGTFRISEIGVCDANPSTYSIKPEGPYRYANNHNESGEIEGATGAGVFDNSFGDIDLAVNTAGARFSNSQIILAKIIDDEDNLYEIEYSKVNPYPGGHTGTVNLANDEILISIATNGGSQTFDNFSGMKWIARGLGEGDFIKLDTDNNKLYFYTERPEKPIKIDGELDDDGWKADGWTEVNGENGFWQSLEHVDPDSNTLSYKYQLRSNGEYLYVTSAIDCALVAGGNGSGTNLRFWIKTNDEAAVYTHFYDVFFNGDTNTVDTHAKYNTSTTANVAADIQDSTINAAIKSVGDKTYVEFKVKLAEFGGEEGFPFYMCVSNKADGQKNICLYNKQVPVIEGLRRDNYLPYNNWDSDHNEEADIQNILIGNIVYDVSYTGNSLTLGSDIAMNFYMQLHKIAKNNGTMTLNIGERTETVQIRSNNNGSYFAVPLNVLEMNEDITAKFKFNNVDYVSEYSVSQYIYDILGKQQYSDNAKALARKIANYGHYVQTYLASIHENVTIGDGGYKRMDKFEGQFDINLAEAQRALADYEKEFGKTDNISLYGRTVYFDTATALNYYVTVANGVKPTATAVGKNNKKYGVDIKLYKKNIYIISIKDILATELGDDITVTVNAGSESIGFTSSVLDYCGAVMYKEGQTEAAQKAMAAFYEYYKAAVDYENSKNQ